MATIPTPHTMKYLLAILTICAIIGSVWYPKNLQAQYDTEIDVLDARLKTVQAMQGEKITRLDNRLEEQYHAVDLEKADYHGKLQVIQTRLNATQERKAQARQIALSHRALSAKEWEATLATFQKRRQEIALQLEQNRRQITSNNVKLADIIQKDTEAIASREDSIRRSARASMNSGRAGGRATSYAIIDAKEAMQKKHKDMTAAVGIQNKRVMESIQTMENELVQMDRAEEEFMNVNSPHKKNYGPAIGRDEFGKAAHPDILKLQNEHKAALQRIQRDIDGAQQDRSALVQNLSDTLRSIGKQRVELTGKNQDRLQNARFTGYAAIGILAVLTLLSFVFSNRYA